MEKSFMQMEDRIYTNHDIARSMTVTTVLSHQGELMSSDLV